MITQGLPHFLAAVCLGAMMFFSFLYAPLIFLKLPGEHAAAFVRAVFPWYYATLGAVTAIASIIAAFVASASTTSLVGVCLAFLVTRVWLLPAINRARDRELRGDQSSSLKFKRLHLLSVLINLAQMLVLAYVASKLIVH